MPTDLPEFRSDWGSAPVPPDDTHHLPAAESVSIVDADRPKRRPPASSWKPPGQLTSPVFAQNRHCRQFHPAGPGPDAALSDRSAILPTGPSSLKSAVPVSGEAQLSGCLPPRPPALLAPPSAIFSVRSTLFAVPIIDQDHSAILQAFGPNENSGYLLRKKPRQRAGFSDWTRLFAVAVTSYRPCHPCRPYRHVPAYRRQLLLSVLRLSSLPVVIINPATDAAFCSAVRVTGGVGIPMATISPIRRWRRWKPKLPSLAFFF